MSFYLFLINITHHRGQFSYHERRFTVLLCMECDDVQLCALHLHIEKINGLIVELRERHVCRELIELIRYNNSKFLLRECSHNINGSNSNIYVEIPAISSPVDLSHRIRFLSLCYI